MLGPAILRSGLDYSVETTVSGSLSAAFSACQERLAHLTRIGNSERPENTTSLPRDFRFGRLHRAGDQTTEPLEKGLGLDPRLPLDRARHQGSGGLRDGAARPLKGHVLDDAVFHPEPDGQPVTAERIDSFDSAVGVLHPAEVLGSPIMVQDQVLVEPAETSHQANIFLTVMRPSTRASISARVL